MLLGDFPKRMCHKKFRIVQKINIAIDRSISRGGVGGALPPPPRRGFTPAPRPKTCGDCYINNY
jgi:hypothetical protein